MGGGEGERMQTDPWTTARAAGSYLLYYGLTGSYHTMSPDSPSPTDGLQRFIYMIHNTGGANCNCQEDIITRISF